VPRIEVDTGQLTGAAAAQAGVSANLSELAGRVSAVGSGASVAGAPEAEAALMAWADHWAGSLNANALAVDGLAVNLGASAAAYTTCDATAIP
jgi:hypothetical protein